MPRPMSTHPYARSALIGLVVGIVAGAIFYTVLRLTGTHVNRYLLVAIIVACIPGSIMLSEIFESDEIEAQEMREERQQLGEQGGSTPPPGS
jgi:hypothetical protein